MFLGQNFPNPFNPFTKIKFEISKSSLIKFEIFDLNGRKILTLINEKLNPGIFDINFDGSNLPSGVYIYRLQSDNYSQTKKMILLK
ncbi:MAG: T9SS type A sorting domain-containing protein [Ignavibacteria bacterium]|nr:T9SS type A sorting domain-containing protein [Ignavibacteria bacterium]